MLRPRRLGALILALLSCSYFQTSEAHDLSLIFNDAFKNDPTYQAAEANFNALKETYPQALAKVLPTLSLEANAAASHSDIRGITGGSNNLITLGGNSFGTNGYTVTLTQPLFNFNYFVQLKQADAQVKQAYANYLAAGQDLMVRTVRAYFDVLSAEDTKRFADANKDAIDKQLGQAKARYQTGLETITAVYEAQSAYDTSVAEALSARNDVDNAKEALRELTGYAVEEVAPLDAHKFKLQPPKPLGVEEWVVKATQQNLSLQAARFGMVAARQQIKMNYAGHLPTLNVVTDYTKQNGNFFGSINYGQSDVGLQLSVPIYSGGQVSSQVRQAKSQYIQAGDEVEKTYRHTFVSTRQLFNSVMTDVAKVKADQQSVISHQSTLKNTEAEYQAGTRTMVDVLTAIKNLYQAQQTLSYDRYTYIVDTVLLKQEAGILSGEDIAELNQWLLKSY
ncbi:MAG: TolC family outer membrane protein [Gammaproteobacteria bacterium]|nr:TolC family outer membrane protein [Gammaproteobacteria bacterium]